MTSPRFLRPHKVTLFTPLKEEDEKGNLKYQRTFLEYVRLDKKIGSSSDKNSIHQVKETGLTIDMNDLLSYNSMNEKASYIGQYEFMQADDTSRLFTFVTGRSVIVEGIIKDEGTIRDIMEKYEYFTVNSYLEKRCFSDLVEFVEVKCS